jgi:branched-chain amino acid transport system substrate-binding protein
MGDLMALPFRPTVFVAMIAVLAPLPAASEPGDIVIGVPMDYQAGRPLSTAYRQGETDFVTFVNQRGGVNGHKIVLLDGDHANSAERGISLYSEMRDHGALAFDPLSSIVAQAVTKRALEDEVNLLTIYSGRSDAADGSVFPYIFPASPTYWSEAASVIQYILEKEGGNLRGKTIGFLSTENETGLGKASLPIVRQLADRLGFRLLTGFYPRTGDSTAVLAEYIGARPDWTMMWDGGAGKSAVVKYALQHGIPADRITSLVWLSEADMAEIGDAGTGIVKFEGVATGRDSAMIKDILREVVAPGRGSGPEANVGTTFYDIGIVTMAVVAEAARISFERSDSPPTRQSFHEAMQHITNFTAGGLLPPMTITASDHQGGGAGRIVRWSGSEWLPVTAWRSSDQDLVWSLIKSSSEAFKAAK